MSIITPEFVDRVIRSGPLTEARHRAQDGSARPRNRAQWDRFSSWSLICEEVVDTEHDAEWYDDIVAELSRRGFRDEQVDAMRRFAWETAGWLNYDKMLWEWCRLDQRDIVRALGWQFWEGRITWKQYRAGLSFVASSRVGQRQRNPPGL